MAFFKGFIDTAKAPPPWLRMVNKRGTFFLPLDPRRTPSASLPKLLKRRVLPCQHQYPSPFTLQPLCWSVKGSMPEVNLRLRTTPRLSYLYSLQASSFISAHVKVHCHV